MFRVRYGHQQPRGNDVNSVAASCVRPPAYALIGSPPAVNGGYFFIPVAGQCPRAPGAFTIPRTTRIGKYYVLNHSFGASAFQLT